MRNYSNSDQGAAIRRFGLLRSLAGVLLCAATIAPMWADTLHTRDERYRLQANDVLEIKYRYTPEYNQEVTIQPDGFVNLVLVGDMKAADMTLDQFRTKVLDQAKTRLRDPEITIALTKFEKSWFMVGGEVEKPGKFELSGTTTALEAITMAGGFKTSSKHSQVLMLRKVNDQTAETRLLDLKDLVTHRRLEEDLDIQPGDFLYVPQNKISKIERFVKWGSMGVFVNPIP